MSDKREPICYVPVRALEALHTRRAGTKVLTVISTEGGPDDVALYLKPDEPKEADAEGK